MKERLKQSATSTDSSNSSGPSSEGEDAGRDARLEQERVDRILHSLFFSGPNKLLSEGIEFDANVR